MENSQQISLFQEQIEQPLVDDLQSDTKQSEQGEQAVVSRFDTGDRVRIVINVTEDEDVESYFYLKPFENKRGEIMKVISKPTLQYEVLFGKEMAIVYHSELVAGWPKAN